MIISQKCLLSTRSLNHNICLLLLISKLWHKQASDFQIERKQVVFLCWMQDSNLEGLWNRISIRLNARWETDWAIENQAKTRTTRMPMFWWYPPLPNGYPYYWVILDPKLKEYKVKVTNLKNSPKFQFFKFWNKRYTRHTSSCLIRCANMKWIQQVLLKIQSGHDSVQRWTDGQGETSIPPFQLH